MSTTTQEITVSKTGHVATVTLDRPPANAIDLATSRTMGAVFAAFRDSRDLRVAVLRTASNFDRPHPGQTPTESLKANSGGFGPSTANLVAAGQPLVNDIVTKWASWKNGVPATGVEGCAMSRISIRPAS